MDAETVRQLERINAQFYEGHAESFDRMRQHPWPGWGRTIENLRPFAHILDAGCGAGRFRAFLHAKEVTVARYLGIDRSRSLLRRARERFPDAEWKQCDILGTLDDAPFDLVVAFGVLHHVAGRKRRRTLVEHLAARVDTGGRLVLTVWRFGHDLRIERRTMPWAEYNTRAETPIDEEALEDGDVLIRWQNTGHRYCHQASEEEVEEWINAAGLPLVDDTMNDGTPVPMNRYLIFERP